jgi:hypothetical protein
MINAAVNSNEVLLSGVYCQPMLQFGGWIIKNSDANLDQAFRMNFLVPFSCERGSLKHGKVVAALEANEGTWEVQTFFRFFKSQLLTISDKDMNERM